MKQEHTDRRLCARCVYSVFTSSAHFHYCNYLEYTGERRPHKGGECYGFTPKTNRGRRRQIPAESESDNK